MFGKIILGAVVVGLVCLVVGCVPAREIHVEDAGLGNPSFGGTGLEVRVKPTAATVPGAVYNVDVVFEGRRFGSRPVKWDRLPNMFGLYPSLIVAWGFTGEHRLYQLYYQEQQKPVRDRKEFSVRDYIDIVVTRNGEEIETSGID